MPRKKEKPRERWRTARGLIRLTVYAHEDEAKAVEQEARRQRCSVSEVLRRIIRERFEIED